MAWQAGTAWAASATNFQFSEIEAVRSTWQEDQPPASGWRQVSLPDIWTKRWPDFDGVVWYRLHWEQPASVQTAGLLLDYLNMAGTVYLNGALLHRDVSLVEPLTHAWNTPQYWLLSAPLLHSGNNTLLLRVAGLAAYQPGLGPITIGDPAAIYPNYERAHWLRRDLPLFSLAVTTTLGCVFLILWLMRRQEAAYGWFSLMSVAWWFYGVNQVATSPWPLADTDAWESAVSIAFLLYCACFTMFILRICEQRWPRSERLLWMLAACGIAAMLITPHQHMLAVRNVLALLPASVLLGSCFLLLYCAWRSRRLEQRILALCVMICLAAGIHDLCVFFGVLHSNLYYTVITFQLLLCGMALVLAWRFVNNLRHIEHFNEELTLKIDAAREELAVTLRYQHELEIVNARLGERINLAHDLHDGLGGTLVSSIATLEHAPQDISAADFLAILKELRDDLRIIVDTAASQQHGDYALDELIAPLRHRLTRLFENHRIECHWRTAGLEQCRLPSSQSLDVLRILQESLTNVFKHSRTTRVEIDLRANVQMLQLLISDNGIGFNVAALEANQGTGMRSMRARTKRLGGSLQLQSTPAATVLTVHIPIEAAATGHAGASQSE